MAITITETTSNSRTILTAEGSAATLDELWGQIPATYTQGSADNFYILTGNVTLELKCQLTEDRTGVRAIAQRNSATIAIAPTANLLLGKRELVGGTIEQTGLVIVGSDSLGSAFSSPVSPQNETAIAATLLAVEIEPDWSLARLIKMFGAVLGGKVVSHADGNTTIFRNISDTVNLVTSTASNTSDRETITYAPDEGVAVQLGVRKPLFSEEVAIPTTPENTDVIITANFIKRIIDVKYVFPPEIATIIRINKAEVSGSQITIRASQEMTNSRIIFIGEA